MFNCILIQDTTTAVVKKKPKVFSKDWFKGVLLFPCISAEPENLMLGEEGDDDFEDEQTQENEPSNNDVMEKKQEPILSETVAEGVEETVIEEEGVYEPINVTEVQAEAKLEVQEPERTPTPDPLRAIGAQLLSQLQGYKEDFNKFSNVMEENKPTSDIEEESVTKNEIEVELILTHDKLVTEEEKKMVKNMSNGDAWNHVMGSVVMVSDEVKQIYCFLHLNTF